MIDGLTDTNKRPAMKGLFYYKEIAKLLSFLTFLYQYKNNKMKKDEFLLYGANGYTGQLIARLATKFGLKPILAGRSAGPIQSIAKKLKLEHRVVDLHETKRVEDMAFDV